MELNSVPSGREVLVVEDELRIRNMLASALKEMGFTPTLTSSAEAALRAIARASFDIVILDLNLPGMGGIEFLELIRKNDEEIQVIILTGFGDLDAAKTAVHFEVVEFLTKPCALGQLERAMERARKRRRKQIVEEQVVDPALAMQFELQKPPVLQRATAEVDSSEDGSDPLSMEQLEQRHILKVLQKNNGNRVATATELGISLRKLYYRLGQYQKHAFTLIELLVVIGVIALLVSIMLPVLSRAHDQAQRLTCANNLRQIGLAMLTYTADETDHSLPRTKYDVSKKLQLDNAGYGVRDSFGNSGYVGENNVPASLYLMFKVEKLPPALFICPSSDRQPAPIDVAENSNWKTIPDDMTYSLAAPFPTAAAERAGFRWRLSLPSDFAVIADINPGTRGGSTLQNNVTGALHDAAPTKLAAANSNNHSNRGQNVMYGDMHVEFQTTPYCGAPHPGNAIPDNIYTAGAGDGGICSESALPIDSKDSVCLPTDDPGGK